MQKNILIMLVLLASHAVLQPTIRFGSRDAGFIVDNGVLALGSASLSEGTLVINADNGVTSSGMSCSHMRFEQSGDFVTSVKELNGNISWGTSLTLNDAQKLLVNGGTVSETVSVFASDDAPAIIEGHGNFENSILVSSPCSLIMRWNGPLNADIDLQSFDTFSELILERDLLFGPHHSVRSTFGVHPIIRCAGYRLLFGGDAAMETILTNSMTCINANIELTGSVRLDDAIYTFTDFGAFINGNGHQFAFSNGGQLIASGIPVVCTNIIFSGVNQFSFCIESIPGDGDSLPGIFRFRDVTLESYNDDGVLRSITLTGEIVNDEPNIFDGYCEFESVALSMNTDLAMADDWVFNADSTLNGNNFHLNLNNGALLIEEGVTLTLRNVVLDYVTMYSIAGAGTLNLSGVTIIVDRELEAIDWSSGPTIIVDGPVLVMTGDTILQVKNTSQINGVTLLYDPLGTDTVDRVIGFTGSGRVISVDKVIPDDGGFVPQDLSFVASGSLEVTEYLYPELGGMNSRIITFAKAAVDEIPAGGLLWFDGKGRSLICPTVNEDMLEDEESQAVIMIGDGVHTTQVIMQNVTIEGFKLPYVYYRSVGDALYPGNNTTLRLHEDWVGDLELNQALVLGSDPAGLSEKVILDLQGHVIDLGSSGSIQMQGSADCELHIMNGRIRNIAGNQIAGAAGTTLVFKDVVLELSSTFTIATSSVRFEGHCSITGAQGTVIEFSNAGKVLTIAAGACLTLTDGIIYLHDNTGGSNFVFTNATSQLELIGAQFSHIDTETPLKLTKGVLVIDHKAVIAAGNSGGIWLGDGANVGNNLTVEIRPGATITVQSGVLNYAGVAPAP
jgi:hypothetical protein